MYFNITNSLSNIPVVKPKYGYWLLNLTNFMMRFINKFFFLYYTVEKHLLFYFSNFKIFTRVFMF